MRSTDRYDLIRNAALAAIAGLIVLCAGNVDADEWHKRVAVVDTVSITVVEAPRSQLRAVANRYGALDAWRTQGFAVLVRDTATGEYRCTIYVLNIDDEETVEHETLHCRGWAHR